ncbi:MAG: cell wall hydrolase [Pseudomonadota bacterium]
MIGVGPVAKHRRSKGLGQLMARACSVAAISSFFLFQQPVGTGHLDAARLLGLGGPQSETWQTFVIASPAGSIHQATVNVEGTVNDNVGLARAHSDDPFQVALSAARQDHSITTGSTPSDQARLPAGAYPQVARSARTDRLDTPSTRQSFASRRAPAVLYESHPFARTQLASLPTVGFDGYVGMIPPPPEMMFAQENELLAPLEGANEPETETGSYALALVDPSADGSPLADTEGQLQISAFLRNDRQFECLAEGIYFEARGEPRQGQVAVAQVIMNRVNHYEFPNTICGVVYQNQHWRNRCQFSFACDGIPERINERDAWEMAEDVARQVLEGRDLIQTIADSTHYHATYVRPRWAPRMIRLDHIGLHVFYKGRYGGWR